MCKHVHLQLFSFYKHFSIVIYRRLYPILTLHGESVAFTALVEGILFIVLTPALCCGFVLKADVLLACFFEELYTKVVERNGNMLKDYFTFLSLGMFSSICYSEFVGQAYVDTSSL